MPSASHLPNLFPTGTKYALEGRGRFVRRYVELPDGRRIQLATRKALTCLCAETSIVPEHLVDLVNSQTFRRRSFA